MKNRETNDTTDPEDRPGCDLVAEATDILCRTCQRHFPDTEVQILDRIALGPPRRHGAEPAQETPVGATQTVLWTVRAPCPRGWGAVCPVVVNTPAPAEPEP